jgi:hypothetical protein
MTLIHQKIASSAYLILGMSAFPVGFFISTHIGRRPEGFNSDVDSSALFAFGWLVSAFAIIALFTITFREKTIWAKLINVLALLIATLLLIILPYAIVLGVIGMKNPLYLALYASASLVLISKRFLKQNRYLDDA